MKPFAVALATLTLASMLALIAGSSSGNAGGIAVEFYPFSRHVPVMSIVTYNIVISSDTPTRGIQLDLGFDPMSLDFRGLTTGTYYKSVADSDGPGGIVLQQTPAEIIQEPAGHIIVRWQLDGGSQSQMPSGPGLIASVTFGATVEGRYTLNLSNVSLLSADGTTTYVEPPPPPQTCLPAHDCSLLVQDGSLIVGPTPTVPPTSSTPLPIGGSTSFDQQPSSGPSPTFTLAFILLAGLTIAGLTWRIRLG